MTAPYPTPATPLPWSWPPFASKASDDAQNAAYIVRAANAFPHLVAALESIRKVPMPIEAAALVSAALAIARGEVTP